MDPVPSVEPAAAADPSAPLAVLRGARAAVVFLTRLPAGGFPYAAAEWRWAAAWFPGVGALVGALAGAIFLLAQPVGPFVAAACAVAAGLLATGAFHEDGLADTADALGGATDRQRIFAILKDSRIGTYGAAALAMALLLRVGLLARLDAHAPLALVLAGACARTPPVWLMAALPYVTPAEAARSKPLIPGGRAQAIAATVLCAALLAAAAASGRIAAATVVVLAAVLVAVAAVAGWRFRARAGGITGDFLGATEQVAEVAVLFVLAW
jgi:adenosylcobinamide-GDP ribazoletransferase